MKAPSGPPDLSLSHPPPPPYSPRHNGNNKAGGSHVRKMREALSAHGKTEMIHCWNFNERLALRTLCAPCACPRGRAPSFFWIASRSGRGGGAGPFSARGPLKIKTRCVRLFLVLFSQTRRPNNLSRDLSSLPGNLCSPSSHVSHSIFLPEKWNVDFMCHIKSIEACIVIKMNFFFPSSPPEPFSLLPAPSCN